MAHRENGGTLGMVPSIINPIYTLYSGYLLGPISSFKGLLGGLKQHFPHEWWSQSPAVGFGCSRSRGGSRASGRCGWVSPFRWWQETWGMEAKKKRCFGTGQWLFLVPLKGGR